MAKIQIEVVYAKQEQQALLKLMVEEGTTAQQAVEQSGILQQFPEIDPTQLKLGIFSKAIKSETVLRERDRVEIYRPLIADPKAVRRSRAEAGKVMKKGGGMLNGASQKHYCSTCEACPFRNGQRLKSLE